MDTYNLMSKYAFSVQYIEFEEFKYIKDKFYIYQDAFGMSFLQCVYKILEAPDSKETISNGFRYTYNNSDKGLISVADFVDIIQMDDFAKMYDLLKGPTRDYFHIGYRWVSDHIDPICDTTENKASLLRYIVGMITYVQKTLALR